MEGKRMEPQDAVYVGLRILLEEFYSFIVQEPKRGPLIVMPYLHQKIHEHERFMPVAQAIVNDGKLAKFFPVLWQRPDFILDPDSIKELQSVVIWSDGSAEGMNPLTLCVAIIGDVFRYLWSWGDGPSLDDALKRLPDSIDLARNLAQKQKVKVPAVVSIHNMKLARGLTMQIGRAVLRVPIRYDKFRLAALLFNQDANALVPRLETDFSAIHIRSISRDSDGNEEQKRTQALIEDIGYKSMERQRRNFQNEVNRACLAMVLSAPRNVIFSPVQGWSAAVNPLSDMNHSAISNARTFNSPYPAQTIGKVAERKIARFASLIEQHPDVLKAGIRRLLLAITERMYPEDGFVDAIICWENLFSGTPETTLRVCGAMAKLLSPANGERRSSMYKELGSLYTLRNKIVHGSVDDTPEGIYKSRDLAIKYAIDALRILYTRDDLITAGDSNKRGQMLLLRLQSNRFARSSIYSRSGVPGIVRRSRLTTLIQARRALVQTGPGLGSIALCVIDKNALRPVNRVSPAVCLESSRALGCD
jgi:hypothetical protein